MEYTSASLVSDPWYVAHCKTGKENYAASVLNSQLGLVIYLPEMEIHLQKEIQRVPFFQGYFFLQANLDKVELSRINSSPGILKLLDFGDGPLSVSQTLIEQIRAEISRHCICGYSSHQKLFPGDSVQIMSGPLKGSRGVFIEPLTSGERTRVLLYFLGRLSKVQVDARSLEKVSNELPRRERRTRGKGRRIH